MMNLIKNGEEWVNPETGELYTKKEIEKINKAIIFKQHREYVQNSNSHELEANVRLVTIKESKESRMRTVKEGYKFNMMHRTDLKELMMNNKLSVQESAFIGRLTPFITHPDNDVKVKNQYLTLEELSEFCGFSKNVMTKTIKSLEQLEIIKVVKGGNRPPIIYFNPFLYAAGREVTIDTYMIFEQSKYNPDIALIQENKKENTNS